MGNELVSKGAELMIFGMGTVVVFLALLVVATTLMSYIVQRFFPVAEPVATPGTKAAAAEGLANDSLLAVITAAIHQHRQSKKRR